MSNIYIVWEKKGESPYMPLLASNSEAVAAAERAYKQAENDRFMVLYPTVTTPSKYIVTVAQGENPNDRQAQ